VEKDGEGDRFIIGLTPKYIRPHFWSSAMGFPDETGFPRKLLGICSGSDRLYDAHPNSNC
jgi:hypothetical protein